MECGIGDARSRVEAFAHDGLPHPTTARSASPGVVGALRFSEHPIATEPLSMSRSVCAALAAQTQTLDERLVLLGFCPPEIGEESAPLAHELEQAATRVVILLVGAEVLGESVDALGQQGHLDLRRSSVGLVNPVCLDGGLL